MLVIMLVTDDVLDEYLMTDRVKPSTQLMSATSVPAAMNDNMQ